MIRMKTKDSKRGGADLTLYLSTSAIAEERDRVRRAERPEDLPLTKVGNGKTTHGSRP